MKPTHYFAILIRLFAIALAIYAVRQSSFLVDALTNTGWRNNQGPLVFAWVTVLSPLAISLLLWFFPMTVAASIIRPELNQPFESLSVVNILTVLVLAIGLYTLYYGVSGTIYWLTIWQISTNLDYSNSSAFGGESKAAMVTTAIELILAVLLVARARMISGLMLKLTR